MTKTATVPSPYLTTGQIGQMYGVHRDTVWDWIKTGVRSCDGCQVRLKARRVGGHYRIRQEWLDAFIAACEGQAEEVQPTRSREDARARKAQEQLARDLEK